VKIGAKKDGTITAAQALLKYQAGAFPGSPCSPAACARSLRTTSRTSMSPATTWSANRPKVAAYRAPGATDLVVRGGKSVLDDLARKLGMDSMTLREKNAAHNGTKTAYGPTFTDIGFVETLPRGQAPSALDRAARAEPGPRPRLRLLVQCRGESSAAVHVAEDGSVVVTSGSPDIGGSRASMAMMAAEVLGISVDLVRRSSPTPPRSASPA